MHDKPPTVSWIITTSFQSEHPDFMPAVGAAFVASKIDAIEANPDVWAKTVFILNRDSRRKPPILPDTSGFLSAAKYAAANLPTPVLPGGEQTLPNQEKGNRHRMPSGSTA